MITTLAAVKVHLGLQQTTEEDLVAQFVGLNNTSEDVLLAQLIGACSDSIRAYTQRWLGAFILVNSAESPTVITSYGHGLQTGNTVTIYGSNCSPTIDGEHVITVIDQDRFSVPVAVVIDGTSGYLSRKFTEFYSGEGDQFLQLRQRPVISVESVNVDPDGYFGEGVSAFDSSNDLVSGQDYALVRDNASGLEQSKSGQLARIHAAWPRPRERQRGLLTTFPGTAMGNIRVVYSAGFLPVPMRYQLACCQMVASVRNTRQLGGAVQSETYDYYTYNMAPAAEQALSMGSVKQLLSDIKPWVW